MAITSSAKKAIRTSKKKAVFNARRKSAVHTAKDKVVKLLKQGKKEEAKKALGEAYSAIDKAWKTKYYSKNKASRMKSRLAQTIDREIAKK
jgi:small subunit ribosomal protein S20